MATTVTETTYSQRDAGSPKAQEKSISRGREYTVIPAAHAGGEVSACCSGVTGILLALGVLIAGATLWGLGAAQGHPEMLLAGQVLTGLNLAGIGIMVLLGCCAGCVLSITGAQK